MKPLILILLMAANSFAAWKPLHVIRDVLVGKYGVAVSLSFVGAANASDYRTSVFLDAAGIGQETNPLLLNKQGTLSVDRLATAKVLDFGLPVAVEVWWKWKRPASFAKYRPLILTGNYINAAVIGKAAYGNHQIIIRSIK